MDGSDEIQELIDNITFIKSESKDYEKMKIEEISNQLKKIMQFEQESFKKIEEFEKKQSNPDLIKYAKMLCRNTIQREITDIQEIYLAKIDREYLNRK